LLFRGERFVGDLCRPGPTRKNPGLPESGPTTIPAVRRITQELPDESGRYQTTIKFKLEQVTCHDIRTERNIELEKTDTGSNEKSKPSANVLHVDGNLDSPAAPVIIAGQEHPLSAAGKKFRDGIKQAGRLI